MSGILLIFKTGFAHEKLKHMLYFFHQKYEYKSLAAWLPTFKTWIKNRLFNPPFSENLSMPELAVNYSVSLLSLIRAGDAPIDSIEVGPWFSPQEIEQQQQECPGYPFQFHAGSFISRYRYRRTAIKKLSGYMACTQSQWLSLHLELLPILVYHFGSKFGLNLNPPGARKAKKTFLHYLAQVKNAFEAPIILENLASLPQSKYAYAADPALISEIVRSSGCGFLLDIAHARVASSYLGMKVHDYLECFPLDLVRQIHVSGAREINGTLKDAHEAMQGEDYAILKWLLQRTNPAVVTLEYFRELEPLRQQLWKLREIVG